MAENNKPEVTPGLTQVNPSDPAATDLAAVLVYATYPTLALAEQTGRQLVEEKLAACVNILPVMTSIYRWQGTIETAQEVVLLAKTVRQAAEAVTAFIVANHSYETPAVVVIPIVSGSAPYLQWIADGSLQPNR